MRRSSAHRALADLEKQRDHAAREASEAGAALVALDPREQQVTRERTDALKRRARGESGAQAEAEKAGEKLSRLAAERRQLRERVEASTAARRECHSEIQALRCRERAAFEAEAAKLTQAAVDARAKLAEAWRAALGAEAEAATAWRELAQARVAIEGAQLTTCPSPLSGERATVDRLLEAPAPRPVPRPSQAPPEERPEALLEVVA